MPGKSRRGRGKYSPSKKRRKERSSRPPILTQPPAAAPVEEPVSSAEVPAPTARVPTSAAKPTTFQYPYVAKELRIIGIIAGIILIVLIALAIILP